MIKLREGKRGQSYYDYQVSLVSVANYCLTVTVDATHLNTTVSYNRIVNK